MEGTVIHSSRTNAMGLNLFKGGGGEAMALLVSIILTVVLLAGVWVIMWIDGLVARVEKLEKMAYGDN